MCQTHSKILYLTWKCFPADWANRNEEGGKGENWWAHGGDGDDDDEDMEDQGAQSGNEDLGLDDEAMAHLSKHCKVADMA